MCRLPYAVSVCTLLPAIVMADLSTAAGARGEESLVFLKAGPHEWRPIPAESVGRRLVVRIGPSDTEAGRAMLLVRPPEGMDISDTAPPRITGIKIDGKPKPIEAQILLGRGNWQPRLVAIGVEDRENGVAASTAKFELDGQARSIEDPCVGQDRDTFSFSLPDADYGEHTVSFTVSDTSPQANETRLVIRWKRHNSVNHAVAGTGATLRADSYFEGYPDTAPLQDGKTNLPGDHCQNDISWASAETEQPHWVEVDLGQPREVSEVTLCWALWQDHCYTARVWEVHVADRDRWRTVWAAPQSGIAPRKFTTATFDPVTTQRLRVFQPVAGGPLHRPNIMWLAEVMVR